MLMRKPGPVKAHSFLRLNVPWGSKQNQVILDAGGGCGWPRPNSAGIFGPGWPARSSITHPPSAALHPEEAVGRAESLWLLPFGWVTFCSWPARDCLCPLQTSESREGDLGCSYTSLPQFLPPRPFSDHRPFSLGNHGGLCHSTLFLGLASLSVYESAQMVATD